MIRKVKPRYHFSALGGRPPQFWEREPFLWDDEAGRVSRFVSLGAFGAEATGGKKPRVRQNLTNVIESLNETELCRSTVVLRIFNYPTFTVKPRSSPSHKRHQEPLY